MAEYLTNTADLTAVADAIRAKGGTSAQLVYPAGFVSAIQTIQTGVTPQLIVTTSAGAAITATKGSKTVSGTAGADGTCTLDIPEAGEWSVTAVLGADTRTETVLIGTQNADLRLFKDAFAENDWETIIAFCQSGNIPSTWAVGDSKTMTINGANYQIDIIGKSHDDYADGSGKAPLTFQMHACYATEYAMNSSTTNNGGWEYSRMRTTHLPAILARMPAEVKNSIRNVNKKTATSGTSSVIVTVSDKLFLLSEIEISGSNDHSATGEGTQYDYYKTGGNKVKSWDGRPSSWNTRSPVAGTEAYFCIIDSEGNVWPSANTSYERGVAFAFCF